MFNRQEKEDISNLVLSLSDTNELLDRLSLIVEDYLSTPEQSEIEAVGRLRKLREDMRYLYRHFHSRFRSRQ